MVADYLSQHHAGFKVSTKRGSIPATAAALFNILSSRDGRCSTMVTSQFAPDEWYGSMTDKVIAESLLNRLIAGAEVINIDGPNMRAAPIMN